jgi:trans-aconitate 2-methyltransferase
MSAHYTFGDTDLAVRRLALVAQVFARTSRSLLASAVDGSPGTAVDLGCGPGYSTRLIAEVCRPGRTLGLDSSERHVALARSLTDDPSLTFACHDAMVAPLPGAPADLVYARLLLAHLPDPLGLVAQWRRQLGPDGILVLDEVEAIEAPPGALRHYESLVVALVATGGGAMYAGPILAALGGTCVEALVDQAVAARMYGMNLATWRDDALERGLVGAADLDWLTAELAALETRPGERSVRWVLRQVVLAADW